MTSEAEADIASDAAAEPDELHHLLRRQLRRLDIGDDAPDEAQWCEMLQRVDRTYRDSDRGQQLLERAIDISSREMGDLHHALQQSSESELAVERTRLQLVFESVTSGLVVFDRTGRVAAVNPEAIRLLGVRSTLVDRQLESCLLSVGGDGEVTPLVGAGELARASTEKRWSRPDARLLSAAGRAHLLAHGPSPWTKEHLVAADVVVVPFADDESNAGQPGQHTGGLVVLHDNAERELARERLAWQATHDSLTSLPNRDLVADRIEASLQQARVSGRWPSLLFLDLDRFKHVNDAYGHAVGDRLLATVAARLLTCVRSGDVVGRLSGDEFVILAEDHGDGHSAEALAERIRRTVAEPFEVSGEHTFVSASIGVAQSGAMDNSAELLMHHADLAMYRAKERGRNCVEVVDDLFRAHAAEHALLERELRAAIARRELGVAYQPLRRSDTNELVGFEALARWVHPVLGDVRPDRFVPVAEQTGLIQALGDRMLDVACRDVATWNRDRRQLGLPPIVVHVNISGRELQSPNLLGRVREAMRRHDALSHWVVLEMTETMLLDDPIRSLERLRELKVAGIRVAIDDFGTGYSSLSYLRRYPVHMIKIDREFISDLASSKQDQSIVQAMVDLAHGLDYAVLAEGVETAAELDVLRRLGCEMVQGYFLGMPMPSAEALLMAVSCRTETPDRVPSAWDETERLQPLP
ncbi:MAG: hypothetical protein RLZZ623_2345 [Actinomycetota bacterium]|jgi:diguanylate cyclase (GGDEF)-like protein